MGIDKALLAQAAARARAPQPPTGVAALVAGIHRGALGDWVSLQSRALPPIPYVQDGRWHVLLLLAVPDGSGFQHREMRAPWAALHWAWPGAELVDRREIPRDERIREGVPYSFGAAPAALKNLYRGLDRLVQTAPADVPDLSGLAPLYADLLPAAVVPVVHAHAPGSARWLTVDE